MEFLCPGRPQGASRSFQPHLAANFLPDKPSLGDRSNQVSRRPADETLCCFIHANFIKIDNLQQSQKIEDSGSLV